MQKQQLFNKFRSDLIVGGSFFSALKHFCKVRKENIREFYSSIIEQLDTLLEKNPQKYWEILGNLIHSDKNDNFEISPDQLSDYFHDLNKSPIRNCLDIFDKLIELELIKV